MLVKVSKFIAIIFYLIGVVGSVILFGRFDSFNYAMSSFFGLDSFEEVTNTMIFIFLLANISVGVIIHLLAEVLNYIILIYSGWKSDSSTFKKVDLITSHDPTQPNVNVENTKEELSFFYSLLLKIQSVFNRR